MGGLRLSTYEGPADALLDALRLSRAMSYKNAAAGLNLGGGKAVLLDDGEWNRARAERMRAVARAVARLDGKYVTAEDVGTTPEDMSAIAEVTPYVAGQALDRGGRGDPAPQTARTTFSAIEAAVRIRLRRMSLDGVRVGVQGVGRVGRRLVALLSAAGAEVLVADIDADRAQTVAAEHRAAVLPFEDFVLGDFEVLAPCALGGSIGHEHLGQLRASVIAGAANNPLATRALAPALEARGVLYVPDFLANCGGIIHLGAQVLHLSEEQVEDLLVAAARRTEHTLEAAAASGRYALELAEELAEERLRRTSEAVA